MKTVIFIATVLVLVGCVNLSDRKEIIDSKVINISVNSGNYRERMPYSQLFDSVRYVKIETGDESIIGNIAKIRFYKNRFYILDSKQSVLLAFGETGDFLWKIDKRGPGPGEYLSIADFDLNNNRLFLYDPHRSMLEYDLSGDFVKGYPVDAFGTSIAVNDSFFYIYTCNYPSKKGNYHLLITNNCGRDFKAEIPMIHKNLIGGCSVFQSKNAFCRYDDEIRFFMPFSTKIYSIAGDSISVHYNIDFGEYNIPENYFESHTKDDIRDSPYAYGLNTFWETDAYFCFNLYFNRESWEVFYSKKENELTYGRFYDDLSFCYPTFHTVNNDYALGCRPADELFDEYNHSKEDRKDTLLEKIVSGSDTYDNPVIFFYYFKKTGHIKQDEDTVIAKYKFKNFDICEHIHCY